LFNSCINDLFDDRCIQMFLGPDDSIEFSIFADEKFLTGAGDVPIEMTVKLMVGEPLQPGCLIASFLRVPDAGEHDVRACVGLSKPRFIGIGDAIFGRKNANYLDRVSVLLFESAYLA